MRESKIWQIITTLGLLSTVGWTGSAVVNHIELERQRREGRRAIVRAAQDAGLDMKSYQIETMLRTGWELPAEIEDAVAEVEEQELMALAEEAKEGCIISLSGIVSVLVTGFSYYRGRKAEMREKGISV